MDAVEEILFGGVEIVAVAKKHLPVTVHQEPGRFEFGDDSARGEGVVGSVLLGKCGIGNFGAFPNPPFIRS